MLVYRTDKYKRLKAEVEKQSKKRKYSSDTRKRVLLLLLQPALADDKLNGFNRSLILQGTQIHTGGINSVLDSFAGEKVSAKTYCAV